MGFHEIFADVSLAISGERCTGETHKQWGFAVTATDRSGNGYPRKSTRSILYTRRAADFGHVFVERTVVTWTFHDGPIEIVRKKRRRRQTPTVTDILKPVERQSNRISWSSGNPNYSTTFRKTTCFRVMIPSDLAFRFERVFLQFKTFNKNYKVEFLLSTGNFSRSPTPNNETIGNTETNH